jgi:hypothetical protein
MNSYMDVCRDVQNNSVVMWFTSGIVVSLLIWLAHYFSVFLTIGSMVMIDLRILGLTGKNQTVTEVTDYYSPWMKIGLSILVVTGLLMLAGDATLFCRNNIFGINLLATAVAAVTGILIRKWAPGWERPSGTPAGAKLLAGFSILLWLFTILSAVEVPALSNVP